MAYTNIKVPAGGAKISIQDGKLQVPDEPIIPFIEGDGTGSRRHAEAIHIAAHGAGKHDARAIVVDEQHVLIVGPRRVHVTRGGHLDEAVGRVHGEQRHRGFICAYIDVKVA